VDARGLETIGHRSPPVHLCFPLQPWQPTTGHPSSPAEQSSLSQRMPSLAPQIALSRAPPVEGDRRCPAIRTAASPSSPLGCCALSQLAAAPTSTSLDATGGREYELVAAGTDQAPSAKQRCCPPQANLASQPPPEITLRRAPLEGKMEDAPQLA
jgi:hypothetical protein